MNSRTTPRERLLRHHSYGTGKPIVLLHGYLSDSSYWKPLVPVLAERAKVITIDLLGFGKSPKPRASSYSLDDHVATVHRTLARLVNTPVTFISHSMGCLVAAEYARQYPDAVAKLYLLNMPIYTSARQAKQELLSTNKLYRAVLFARRKHPLWVASKYLLPVFGTKKLRAVYSRRHTEASRSGSLHNTILSTNALTLLQHLRVPTVLVEGVRDRLIYGKNLQTVDLPPTVSLYWVQSGHHSLHSSSVPLRDVLPGFSPPLEHAARKHFVHKQSGAKSRQQKNKRVRKVLHTKQSNDQPDNQVKQRAKPKRQ